MDTAQTSGTFLATQRKKCVKLLRHFLRTDLYFLVNPVQLALTLVFKVLVLQEKIFSENKFLELIQGLKVDFSLFGKSVLALMENFDISFFSNEKIEAANKKFKIIQSIDF